MLITSTSIILLLLAIWLLRMLAKFLSYRQPPGCVFVRDDSREELLSQIVFGNPDANTALFKDCAKLSANIYRSDSTYANADHVLKSNDRFEMENWQPCELPEEIKCKNGHQDAGLLYEVWENPDKKLIALVFRGTVRGLNSWAANLHTFVFKYVPFFRDQYDEIKLVVPAVVSALEEKFSRGYAMISTGHSLGGGLAQHALYLAEPITKSFAFNSSPFTGWSDIPPSTRDENVKGNVVYRIHENGEALEFLRLLVKIGYVFNPRPNENPHFREHRLNAKDTSLVDQHGIMHLAFALDDAAKKHTPTAT